MVKNYFNGEEQEELAQILMQQEQERKDNLWMER